MARTKFYISNGTYARKDLCELIEKKRKLLGIKLKDLADAVGISDRYISQKINKGSLNHRQLYLLFDKLEFSGSEILLVFGHNIRSKPGNEIMKTLSNIEKEISGIMEQIEIEN